MSEADKKAVWHSGITRIQPNKVAVRGYDIAELPLTHPWDTSLLAQRSI